MIGNVEELKELILWAKEERIKVLKIDEVVIEFSELAFVDHYADLGEAKNTTNPNVGVAPHNLPDSLDNAGADTTDEDLYWSSGSP